jgi:hypothetical protein
MLPTFLVPENVVRENGAGPVEFLEDSAGKAVLLTLGITRIIEQESLDVAVMGSSDGQTWDKLSVFPQKFYCGTYSMLLDLSAHPEIRMLRVEWKMNRWGRGDPTPLFGFYMFAEVVAQPVASAVA